MYKKFIYISIIGKSNVGKSTLFNQLIKKKISITSKKKNTTINYIIGINTKKNNQYVYIDTPGYKNYQSFKKIFYITNNYFKKKLKINKKLNLIILLLENKNFFFYEKKIIKKINSNNIPILILINKIDKIKNKEKILTFINKINKNIKYNHIIPISAKKKNYIIYIKKIINNFLINCKHIFKKKEKTIHNIKYIISEIIREKILRLTGDEIPYNLFIKINKIIKIKNTNKIYCIIYVKKKNYIPILIGNSSKKIKKIIFNSIKDIKKYYNYLIKIKLFIKIKILKKW